MAKIFRDPAHAVPVNVSLEGEGNDGFPRIHSF